MPGAVLRVIDIMTNKVISVSPSDTVYDAVSKMLSRDIGSVIVENGTEVKGIITKGDVLRKVVRKGLNPRKVRAEKIMSHPIVSVDQDSSVEEASRLMSQKKVSKLPVLKDGELVGIVTSTDIIRSEPSEIEYLQELIRARFVPHDM